MNPSISERILLLITLIAISWCAMTTSHEAGHILGGWICGGTLSDIELRPWRLPYSFFNPDPNPLITLWAGPLLGALLPLLLAWMLRHNWSWFIAHFCVLANGLYIAIAWYVGESELDTTKLLRNGAHPATVLLYCALAIPVGYLGFRRQCTILLSGTNHAAMPDDKDVA